MLSSMRVLGALSVLLLATASPLRAQFPSELVGFNGPPIDENTAHEMVQIPEFSGTTADFVVPNDPNAPFSSNNAFRSSFSPTEGVASLEVFFDWVDETDPSAWMRLTTFEGPEQPNPALDLRGKVRFTIINLGQVPPFPPVGEIGICLGIRETGVDAAQLEDGGTTGDIEWVGVTGTAVIPNDPNDPNDDTLRPVPAITLPPDPNAVSLEWDLSTGNVFVNGVNMGGEIFGFTGDGVLSAPNDRGTLEHIAITNVAGDPGVTMRFLIDELQVEATVPDPTPPPVIVTPVFETDLQVDVQMIDGATEAELFVGEMSAGTETPVNNVATFDVSLTAGQVLTATQTANGLTSEPSLPVIVFAQGVIMADNFDTYATQADLNLFWMDSISNPSPSDAKLLLQPGGAASCPNFLREENPSGSDAARLYRSLGGVNGSDVDPLTVTWHFRYTGEEGGAGARTRFELAHFDGGPFSVAERGDGTCGITLFNQVLGDLFDQYNLVLRVADPNDPVHQQLIAGGWVDAGGFLRAASGVPKQPNVWHKMQIEVRQNTIDYLIDDVPVNPPGFESGVPRPNNTAYDYVIIGQGFSNNGPLMMFDNVAVTQGAAFPFGDPVTPAPTIVEPLFPEAATVSLSAVDPHATEVTVFSNGGQIGNVVQAGFPGGTADVPISPSLVNGADITATQIVGGLESCDSIPVTVAVPAVSIADAVLVPGQTTVQVADLAEGAASQVRVFKNETTAIGTAANPATDPVTVTTAALGFGDTITATQTIGGVQGPASVGIDVTVPAPTLPGPAIVGDTIVTVADLHSLATDATVYVNGSPVGSAPTGGQGVVSVMIGASLIANDEVTATQTIGGTEGDMSDTIIAEPPLCFEFFADDLNTDTSAAWNVVIFDSAAENDANAVFAFDYSAVGVPASPNGGGTTRGLKFVVNQGGTAATASVTASPAGQNFTAANGYRLAFDMWINANGPFPDGGGGSTEFLTAGVGYDNTTPNLGNATGNGGWFAISGESGSSRDVRPYKDDEEQFPESGQYAAGTTSGVHNNTNNDEFYFDLFGTPSPPAEQTALFPNQTGDLLTGSAGFAWHEVNITALETKARWEIDGTTIVTLDTTIGNPFSGLDGNVSLGYMDVFTSISDNPAVSFGLVDNVKVFVTHTPGTNGDWDNDSNVDIDDFQAFEDCMGGPGLTPDPSSGLGCASTCNGVFDADLDDDMDMGDFAEFQVQFMP